MNYTRGPVPLLIIEDELGHYNAIKARLTEKHSCEITWMENHDRVMLFNFKAKHPDCQLVIVDLELGEANHSNYEGWRIVEFLQATDKTMFFIIFTKHPLPAHLAPQFVCPHITYVPKKITRDDRTISEESLRRLDDVVAKYLTWCAPHMEVPLFEGIRYNEELLDFVAQTRFAAQTISPHVTQAIDRSLSLLRKMTTDAIEYNKGGACMEHIGVGVFGSCGRMEARADSDVELAVFYAGRDEPDRRQMAVTVWNRATSYLRSLGIPFEGEQLISKSAHGYLEDQDVTGVVPPQGYVPVIAVESLHEKLKDHPHLRDRHLQLLTELRATYNPRFIAWMKWTLLTTHEPGASSVRGLVEGDYLKSLLLQYELDTAARVAKTWKDMKTLTYRALNIMSTRLWLVGQLIDRNRDIASDAGWNAFCEGLCSPGLLKIVRTRRALREAYPEHFRPIEITFNQLIDGYADLLSQLIEHGARLLKDGDTENPIPQGVAPRFRLLFDRCSTVFSNLKTIEPLWSSWELANWLTAHDHLKDLSMHIEGQ